MKTGVKQIVSRDAAHAAGIGRDKHLVLASLNTPREPYEIGRNRYNDRPVS